LFFAVVTIFLKQDGSLLIVFSNQLRDKIQIQPPSCFYSVWFLDFCFSPITFTAKKNDLIGKKESRYQLCFCFLS
jgi:hypothetical protein